MTSKQTPATLGGMADLVAFWVLGVFVAGCGGALYDRATDHLARVGGVVGLAAGGLLLLMAAVGSGVMYGLSAYGAARAPESSKD